MMDLEALKASARDAKRAADAFLDGMGHLQVVSDALSGQGVPCRFEVGGGEVSLIADFSGVLAASRLFGDGAVAVATPAPEAEPEIAVVIPAPAEVAERTPMAVPPAEKPEPVVSGSQFAPVWDDESIQRLSDFWRQGLSIPEIAKKMGRGEKQVKNKTYNMRKKGKLPERNEPVPPAAKVEQVVPVVAAADKPEPTEATAKFVTVIKAVPREDVTTRSNLVGDALALLKLNPVKVGAWANYLKTIPQDDFWTPARDMRLISSICAGKSHGSTAVDAGCDWSECVARFKVLHPIPTTPMTQGALIKALRERAAA